MAGSYMNVMLTSHLFSSNLIIHSVPKQKIYYLSSLMLHSCVKNVILL